MAAIEVRISAETKRILEELNQLRFGGKMNDDVIGTETKPGYLTTEFWLTMIANVGGVLDLTNAWHFVPHKWAVIGIAVINAAYAHSRGVAKSGVPYNP